MKQFIGCDVHKRYSVFVTRRAMRAGLCAWPPGMANWRPIWAASPPARRWPRRPPGIGIGCWMRSRRPVWNRIWRTPWRPST
jgi:hypothetical protein